MPLEDIWGPRIVMDMTIDGGGGGSALTGDDSPPPASNVPTYNVQGLIDQLAKERQTILDDPNSKPREKLKLLESNTKSLAISTGGTVTGTENVVYGILIFGGVVLTILALLTAFAGLSSEVTVAFVGTVLGGTMATIAQKLGKI